MSVGFEYVPNIVTFMILRKSQWDEISLYQYLLKISPVLILETPPGSGGTTAK